MIYTQQRRSGWQREHRASPLWQMIQIRHVTKNFDKIRSLDDVSAVIRQGSIFGLVGSNGAGKSTLLRVMCGIYKPDEGQVSYGENAEQELWENTYLKQEIVYLSDEQYFFPHSTIADMAGFYRTVYKRFSMEKYQQLLNVFHLDPRRKLNTFSKGMKKQASILLALAVQPQYLLCDETFDGLDPVMRQFVKGLLAAEVAENRMTPVIASHNLRELEDICDRVGLLHRGGILFDRELDALKGDLHKVQVIFTNADAAPKGLKIVQSQRRGSVQILVLRGKREEVEEKIRAENPIFYEMMPLTLEEIFISEMEEKGYDFKAVIS